MGHFFSSAVQYRKELYSFAFLGYPVLPIPIQVNRSPIKTQIETPRLNFESLEGCGKSCVPGCVCAEGENKTKFTSGSWLLCHGRNRYPPHTHTHTLDFKVLLTWLPSEPLTRNDHAARKIGDPDMHTCSGSVTVKVLKLLNQYDRHAQVSNEHLLFISMHDVSFNLLPPK